MRKSIRFAVLERDGFRCRYCGAASADGATLHVDHIHPRAHGGDQEDMDNLVTACLDCNLGKSARLLGVTEQPVIFRGKTADDRPRRRRQPKGRQYPVTPLEVEVYEEGSHCATPLKVAAIGVHLGLESYRQTWLYLEKGGGEKFLPPHRMADRSWFTLLKAEADYARELGGTLVQSLEISA